MNFKKNIFFNCLNFFRNIDLVKIYSIILTLIISYIFIICIFDSNYQLNPFIILFFSVFIFISISIIYKKLDIKFKSLSNKSSWIFYVCISLIMCILQFLIGYLVRTNPSWDLGLCIKSAQEILEFGHSTDMAGYYIQAPNNIFITLLLAFTIKLFNLFSITNVNVSTLIMNIIFIQLAVLFLFKITKKIFNNFTACFVITLVLLFLPFYPYSTIMYTDTTSIFLPLAFMWCFIRINEIKDKNNKTRLLYSFIIGVLAFLSLRIKVTALIMLIAYIIYELTQKKFAFLLKNMAVALLAFLVINLSYITIIKNTQVMGIPYEDTKQIPFTHFIMMGMTGSGAFSAEEWQYTLNLPDYETRKEAHINVIKSRLKSYGTQGYIKFLNNKIKGQTWSSGTYDFESILNSYNVDENIAHEFLLSNGKYYSYIYNYCQIYHFTMIFGMIVSFIYSVYKGSQENSFVSVSKLSVLGLILFLLIWETRSRYMLNFIPIYIFIFVTGIIYFKNDTNKIFKMLFYKKNSK